MRAAWIDISGTIGGVKASKDCNKHRPYGLKSYRGDIMILTILLTILAMPVLVVFALVKRYK